MILTLEIVFWFCVFLVFYSYLFYPLFVKLIAKSKNTNSVVFADKDELPVVSILMAAHNEAKVIEKKIKSVFQGNYPTHKIEFLIGSDNSTDDTNEIVKQLQFLYPQIVFHEFKNRNGKIRIINNLVEKAQNQIMILTDSNVIFEENTIQELVKHFKNEKIGLVDTKMINTGLKMDGISIQEKTYINAEVDIKHAEGKLWGAMMGPFGGCFAIRKEAFKEVPENFLVDDFFLNMYVLKQGYACINEPNAIVFEDVSNDLHEEFRRKIRISAGNYQNLMTFKWMLFKFNGVAFAFLSHKVLRWKIPFIILLLFSILPIIYHTNIIYLYFLITTIHCLFFIGLDLTLKFLQVNVSAFRFLTHFAAMNLALFLGFFKYVKGIKNSVWEPTKRFQ